MAYSVPRNPKIYHIVHIDRLPEIIRSNALFSDSRISELDPVGTTIGMGKIKKRRLTELTLSSHPDLYVGSCVPFYFCPRSIMLYMLHMDNHPELGYHGGQKSIVHLEADLYRVIKWADTNYKRWAFTTSNAGSYYFEDSSDINQLNKINWNAVNTHYWSECIEEKQAEFLIEDSFPLEFVERIGVYSQSYINQIEGAFANLEYSPCIEVKSNWYY